MNDARPPQIKGHHLQRLAIVYIRQSTARQVVENTGSTDHQRAQKEYALRWGWPPSLVEVIEDDLGLSGTSGDRRTGWQAVLKKIANYQAGLILAADTSRLTRSSQDFETLLALCQANDTLLAVEGAIVDPNDSANRLLARLRGNVAQYENEQRAEMFMKAKRTKARQGHAVSPRPTGYVVSQKGRWVKDPDSSVRGAIEAVFTQYQALGSAGKVLRFLGAHEIKLPVRKGTGELIWNRPTRARLNDMLRNPAYAGFYVYGRRPARPGSPPDRRRVVNWQHGIVVSGHHEGYISAAQFEQIDESLRRNRLAYQQPTGDGPALCQGLIRCGRCERSMRTRYTRHVRSVSISYQCCRAQLEYGDSAPCCNVNGNRLDDVVAAELLKALAPPDLEAVLAAAEEVNAGYAAACRQRQAELARARYDAEWAKRQYDHVDPANRNVAATLEHNWEVAEEQVREVERKQAATPLAPPLEITPDTLQAIRDSAADLPGLWVAPSTTNLDRKQLVRLLVREVRVVAVAEVEYEVDIAWVGGAVTRHRIFRLAAGRILARRLAAEGRTAAEIAAELTRLGITNWNGRPYTPTILREVIAGNEGTAGLPWVTFRETLRAPLIDMFHAGWTDAAIAAEFNRRGYRRIQHGRLWNPYAVMALRLFFRLLHKRPARRGQSEMRA